ncbi:MAG TPA: hypothetical protein DCS93_40350 [Microscillaceae bacterium]|nr:hypothetical protein [Microscillaceae bacterium]
MNFQKLLICLLFSVISFSALSQNDEDNDYFLPLRYSIEFANSQEFKVGSVGLHPEIFLGDDISIGYSLRLGLTLDSTNQFYINYPLGLLWSIELFRNSNDDNFYYNIPLAVLAALVPQRISYHIEHTNKFRSEIYLEPLATDYIVDLLNPQPVLSTGVRLNFMVGPVAISPYAGIRTAYDGSVYFATFGLMLSGSFN